MSRQRKFAMTKRGLQDGDAEADSKAQFGQRPTADSGDVEMGEFEDPWEDELEEEEEIIEEGDEEDEDEGVSLSTY
jgi:ribosome assembly protein RRB1